MELSEALWRLVRCEICHDANGWTVHGLVISDALILESGRTPFEWAYQQALVRKPLPPAPHHPPLKGPVRLKAAVSLVMNLVAPDLWDRMLRRRYQKARERKRPGKGHIRSAPARTHAALEAWDSRETGETPDAPDMLRSADTETAGEAWNAPVIAEQGGQTLSVQAAVRPRSSSPLASTPAPELPRWHRT